jgi:hypothetical protein
MVGAWRGFWSAWEDLEHLGEEYRDVRFGGEAVTSFGFAFAATGRVPR